DREPVRRTAGPGADPARGPRRGRDHRAAGRAGHPTRPPRGPRRGSRRRVRGLL
ncbi:MAG: hypothetical protein AVDCRST_MAG24-505, partial [uncultured Nocardioidaceae bacterium]